MGTIEGTVTDGDGTPIENAFVEVTETVGTTSYGSATTDQSGYYSIDELVSLTYDVTARHMQHATSTESDVFVGTTQTVTVDFTLVAHTPKVIGNATTSGSIGLHASGSPIGVLGEVPATGGLGLCTPDDARIDGDVHSTGTWCVDTSDRRGNVGNVVQGSQSNSDTGSPTGQTISGGADNRTDAGETTVCGGRSNEATGPRATVGGGYSNVASGWGATIPGGEENAAAGNYSLAAGRQASADHDGAFVVGDSSNTAFSSDTEDEVAFQAGGGFTVAAPSLDLQGQLFSSDGSLHLTGSDLIMAPSPPSGAGYNLRLDNGQVVIETSSTRYKEGVQPIEGATDRVLDLEPRSFEYADRPGGREVGLIAEEVEPVLPELVIHDEEGRPDAVQYERLGALLVPAVRENRERLEAVDQAAAARRTRVSDLEAENRQLATEVAEMEATLDAKEERIATLEDRLDKLTERLETLEDASTAPASGPAD